jgi:hypothetical protein
MSRRLPFTQADVSRAVKGARAAGLPLTRVEIDQAGKIVLVAGQETAPATPDIELPTAEKNEWDEVLQ